MSKLCLLTLGAGAIGTYIGGSLALQGHHIVFIERPEIAEKLKVRGLKLTLGDHTHQIPNPEVVSSFDEALSRNQFDATIFALKSYHTQDFIKSFPESIPTIPPFLCLSNGVDNEPALADTFGPESVIAGTVSSAIGRNAVGDITLERLRGVGIAGGHALSEKLCTAFEEAGLKARLYPKPDEVKWSKMLTNLIANASTAILDLTPAEVFSHPDLYRLEITQLREALSVMKALGLGVVDLPGTPVRALALAARNLPLRLSQPILAKAVGGGRGGKMPSFHIDLHSGSGRSEVDYLNGAVVRAGFKLEIPTPVNQLLTTTLLKLTQGEIPLNTFRHQPDKLLSQIEYP